MCTIGHTPLNYFCSRVQLKNSVFFLYLILYTHYSSHIHLFPTLLTVLNSVPHAAYRIPCQKNTLSTHSWVKAIALNITKNICCAYLHYKLKKKLLKLKLHPFVRSKVEPNKLINVKHIWASKIVWSFQNAKLQLNKFFIILLCYDMQEAFLEHM